MNKLSLSTLGKVAIGIALGGSGMLYATRWTMQSKIRESPMYKEALEYFHGNANARDVLGEPIKEKRVDVGDDNCYGCKDNVMWVSVPLVGKKCNGHLHYWVTMEDPTNNSGKLRVSRIELEIDGSAAKKITLKNDTVVEKSTLEN